MAKKRSSGRTSPNASPTKPEGDAQAQLTALRDEGNKLFGKKEYTKALECYDKALKSVQAGHPDKPLLHSNKAACHMMGKRYKEAVNECTAALDAQPGYHKALTRRGKAYEQLGLYKQALSDVQKANKSGDASPETLEAEKRLKDIMSGKRPSSTLATANGTAASKKQSARPQRSTPYVFHAKVQLDNETRSVTVTGQATYAELQHNVREKFPDEGPLILKYLDREGDLVTITDRQDLHIALREVVEHADRLQSQHGGPKLPHAIPPLRIHAVRAAKESDVPQPPADEADSFQKMQAARKYIAEQAQKQQQLQQQKKDEPSQEQQTQEYAVDQWIIDFANLFREHTGVDPDKHLDLTQLGWDKCTQAMEDAIASDKAEPIFQQAADKFQEVAATGMLQWGNVYLSMARKFLDEAATKGNVSKVAERVHTEFDKAAAKYKEAMDIKADFYDGEMQLGQIDFERAKLAAGFTPEPVKVTPTDEEGKARTQEQMQELVQAAHSSHTRKALDNIKKEDVEKSQALFSSAVQHYEDAIKLLPEEERNKPIKQQQAGDAPPAEEDVNFYAQSLVLIGNLLYEQSQLSAAVGRPEWKEQVEKAAKLFRQAGCVESDIRSALVSHIKHEELDIPAEEPKKEPEAADTNSEKAAATEPEAAKESVKGLPSLKPKPKGGKKSDKDAVEQPDATSAQTEKDASQ